MRFESVVFGSERKRWCVRIKKDVPYLADPPEDDRSPGQPTIWEGSSEPATRLWHMATSLRQSLSAWLTPPAIQADISGVERRLDDLTTRVNAVGVAVRTSTQPRAMRTNRKWALAILTVALFVVLITSVINSSQTNRISSGVQYETQQVSQLEESEGQQGQQVTTDQLNVVTDLELYEFSQASKDLKTELSDNKYLGTMQLQVEAALKNQQSDENAENSLTDQDLISLIGASIAAVLLGGVLSYLIMRWLDASREAIARCETNSGSVARYTSGGTPVRGRAWHSSRVPGSAFHSSV